MRFVSDRTLKRAASFGKQNIRLILYVSVFLNVSFLSYLAFLYSGAQVDEVVQVAHKHITKPLMQIFTGDDVSVKYGEPGQITYIEKSLENKLLKKLDTVDFNKGVNWLLNTEVDRSKVKVRAGDLIEFKTKKKAMPKPEKLVSNTGDNQRPHAAISNNVKDGKKNVDNVEAAVDVTKREAKNVKTPKIDTNDGKLEFDIRTTLALYLFDIRTRLQKVSSKNSDAKQSDKISVPFAWKDWVDLTYLNRYITLPNKDKPTCKWLNSEAWKGKVSREDYCINAKKVPFDKLRQLGFQSASQLPGVAILDAMDEPFSEEARLLIGKSHLLTFSPLPFNIIFLAPNGSYEVAVGGRRSSNQYFLEKYARVNKIELDEDTIIELDPLKEFNALLNSVPPRPSQSENVKGGFDKFLQKHDYEFKLDPKMFHISDADFDKEVDNYQSRLSDLRKLGQLGNLDEDKYRELALSVHEYSHYEAILYSKKFTPENMPRYFHLARLTHKTEENADDTGWHYEWRFFDGRLKYAKEGFNLEEMREREKIILHRLVRNWFRFQYQRGIISWLTHGGLLAWYWGGMSFPYDIDQDVQMPVQQLNSFAKKYNQTLVVEDLTEGFGRFFIDVSSFVTIREAGNKMNNIDARFIDVDTGLYIDITGLAKTKQDKPERYLPLVKDKKKPTIKDLNALEIYNCREPQFYHINELSPLRYSLYEGVPMLVPSDVKGTMEIEYSSKAVNYPYYDGHYYVKHLRLWIREVKLLNLLGESGYKNKGKVNVDAIIEAVENLTHDQVLQLLDDEGIFKEFYLTHGITMMHEKEKAVGTPHIPKLDTDTKEDYVKLVSQFHREKPLRKPLFQYQQIERPEHHKEEKKGKKKDNKKKASQSREFSV